MKRKVLMIALALFIGISAFAQERSSERVIKRKVAIGRFTNETQYAKGLFYDKENDPMRKQALDILSTKLASTGKFILLERDDLDLLMKEKGELNKLGADYLILGSITEFGRKNEGTQGVFTSKKTQIVEAGVSIRLVDADTGLIIYSDEGKGYAETTTKETLGVGGKAGYDATLSDKAISAALTQLVENITNKCMDKPWKSFILSVDDGMFIMAGGKSQGLIVGDKFAIYTKGKTVTNPQTGIKIELPGKKVGVVTVNEFYGDTPESEISMCSYEGADIDANNLTNYYISEDK